MPSTGISKRVLSAESDTEHFSHSVRSRKQHRAKPEKESNTIGGTQEGVMMHRKTCFLVSQVWYIRCAALWHSQSASDHLSMCLTHCQDYSSGFALGEVTRREWITWLLARSVFPRLTQLQTRQGFNMSRNSCRDSFMNLYCVKFRCCPSLRVLPKLWSCWWHLIS